MNLIFHEISSVLAGVKWVEGATPKEVTGFPDQIPNAWPVSSELISMMSKVDEQGRSVGQHVKGVIASINQLLSPKLTPQEFLIPSGDSTLDGDAFGRMAQVRQACWFGKNAIFGSFDNSFSTGLLRIASLYHDVGKIISNDHHVSRGVHLMRDVHEASRESVESLFDGFREKSDFWSLLLHHDVYGALCTGEASLPALADMVNWAPVDEKRPSCEKSVLAFFSYLAWLNIADTNSSLQQDLGGITTVEVSRYLSDWELLRSFLTDRDGLSHPVKREPFRHWSLEVASHPEQAVQRITRLIATSYRKETRSVPPTDHIQRLVEGEIRAFHAARLEKFCFCLARMCKLDYGLRFFYLLMRQALLKEKILERTDSSLHSDYPRHVRTTENLEDKQAVQKALDRMVNRTCLILHRIVEDYGHLVMGDDRSCPLLGLNMSGLMRPPETGWAICRAMRESPARALGWIANEIGVWLYGE